MAQSSGVTSRKDQSTGQFGLRLRRVLILFEDVDAGISRLCAIAENLADTAVLLEPVRARAPNRRRLQSSFHERERERERERAHGYLEMEAAKFDRRNCETTADFYLEDFITP